MHYGRHIICFIIGLELISCRTIEKPPVKSLHGAYKISKFVDGDTFWVADGSKKGMKIRLIGVDAPESRKVFNKPEEPFGKEASKHIKEILRDSLVVLKYDVDSLDRYGRTLAYAYLPDSTFINAQMMMDGYATVMTVPPNVKYADLFLKLQREARENNKGLWRDSI